jgi:hypothetical protein
LVKPITLPTERSIPPVRITNVCPIDKIAMIATWDTTLDKFLGLKKYGEAKHNTIKRTIRLTPTPISER